MMSMIMELGMESWIWPIIMESIVKHGVTLYMLPSLLLNNSSMSKRPPKKPAKLAKKTTKLVT